MLDTEKLKKEDNKRIDDDEGRRKRGMLDTKILKKDDNGRIDDGGGEGRKGCWMLRY
jgi:hypothetical protein